MTRVEVVAVAGPDQPLTPYPEAPEEAPPPPRRRLPSVASGVVGALPALVLIGTAVLLLREYIETFATGATPDSGFNVYNLGALACLLVALLLLPAAFVMLFFRATRPVGIGYLSGLGLIVLASVVVLMVR